MKILQVLNHFLPHQIAGTEIYTLTLCRELKEKGVEVEVVIPNYGKSESDEYYYEDIKVFKYAEPSLPDRDLKMGFKVSAGLNYFKQFIKNAAPDIIHFHELAGSNGITLHHVVAAKETGAKVIFTFHLAGYTCITGTLVYKGCSFSEGKIDLKRCSECYLHFRGFGSYEKLLLPVSNFFFKSGMDTTKWKNKLGTALGIPALIAKQKRNFDVLIKHCDKVVVLTKWYEKMLILNGVDPEKIQFIPQGLPHKNSRTIKNNNKQNDEILRLIFLGRISEFKGLHLLIEAILHLPPSAVELNIYGQSEGSDYEMALKEKSCHNHNIFWHGKLNPEKVVETMQAHDALCLCSTFSEMSPLVIQEAFAAGIPVIASNVYGNAEQITNGYNGLLFDFNDAVSLREQLLRCIADPEILLQLKANIIPPRNFKEVADEYIEVYKAVQG